MQPTQRGIDLLWRQTRPHERRRSRAGVGAPCAQHGFGEPAARHGGSRHGANFFAWLALSGGLTSLLGRRVAPWLCWLAFLAAPLTVCAGVYRLLLMLD